MRADCLAILACAALSAGAARAACDEPERRQFDFWLGAWRVEARRAWLATTASSRSRKVARCSSTGAAPAGGSGTSLNVYDPVARRWLQTWVDRDGTVLRLAGGWNGSVHGPRGRAARPRFGARWTRSASPGRRRPMAACASTGRRAAGGAAWRTVFDGNYRRDPDAGH